jgi:hypothetical protein
MLWWVLRFREIEFPLHYLFPGALARYGDEIVSLAAGMSAGFRAEVRSAACMRSWWRKHVPLERLKAEVCFRTRPHAPHQNSFSPSVDLVHDSPPFQPDAIEFVPPLQLQTIWRERVLFKRGDEINCGPSQIFGSFGEFLNGVW